jgi:hypothetical protein
LRGAILTVAGHDHPVASLAAGALSSGALFDSCGTAEALVRVTERAITPDERVALGRHHITSSDQAPGVSVDHVVSVPASE